MQVVVFVEGLDALEDLVGKHADGLDAEFIVTHFEAHVQTVAQLVHYKRHSVHFLPEPVHFSDSLYTHTYICKQLKCGLTVAS